MSGLASIPELLVLHAKERGQKVAFSGPGHAITFGELEKRTRRTAASLVRAGIGRGHFVANILGRCVEAVESMLAVTRAGAVGVPLDPRSPPADLARALEHSGARVVFTDSRHLGPVRTAVRAVGGGGMIVLVTAPDVDVVDEADDDWRVLRYRDWAEDEACSTLNTRIDDLGIEEEAFLHYTSGTTTAPKGVLSTQKSWLWSADSFASAFEMTSDDQLFWPLPLFHCLGHALCIVATVAVGASAYIPDLDEAPFNSLFNKAAQATTIILGAPATYHELIARASTATNLPALPRLRACMSAGSSATAALSAQVQELFGVPLLNNYGCTEACGAIAITKPGDLFREDSSGIPLPGMEVRVVGPDGNKVKDGEPGEVWIRSPSLMLGYYKETKTPFTAEGWFRTGDIACRSPTATDLNFIGRQKELIVQGGENIQPDELERVLLRCSGVADVVVAGVPHVSLEETPAAFIVRDVRGNGTEDKSTSELDPAALLASCREELPDYKVPTAFYEIDSVPRTLLGKPKRSVVRSFKSRPLTVRSKLLSRESIEALVLAQTAGALAKPVDAALVELDPGLPFDLLGVKSLPGVLLRSRLCSLTGLNLPSTLLYDYPTPAAVIAHIYGRLFEPSGPPPLQLAPAQTTVIGQAEPIAIISMACRYAGGVTSPDDLWRVVADGVDVTSDFPTDRGWDLDALYSPDPDTPGTATTSRGAFLQDMADFDAGLFGMSPREALATDPQQRLLLELTWELMERGRIAPSSLRDSQTGVFIGIMYDDYEDNGLDNHELEAHLGLGSSGSVVSGRVSYCFGLQGPSICVHSGCSSSLVGIHLAISSLRSGESSLAVAGGVTTMATPRPFVFFTKRRGLSADGRCRAYSSDADGTGWSEGVGMLLLERLEDARRNGHRVLGLIRGSAVNSDGASNGLTAPSGPAQQQVIQQALSQAALSPADVDVLEGHGTATPLGDPIEVQALISAYGNGDNKIRRPPSAPLLLGSIKSNIGHSQAAAGVAGVIKMVQAIRNGVAPASLHIREPSRHIEWQGSGVELLTKARPWPAPSDQDGTNTGVPRPRRAAVSSFGIGGTNAHIILEQAVELEHEQAPEASTKRVYTFPWLLSGANEAALRAQARALVADETLGSQDPINIAFSLVTARSALQHRAAVISGSVDSRKAALVALGQGQQYPDVVTGPAKGQTISSKPCLAFLFSGQGGRLPNIGGLDELCVSFPVFSKAFRAACDELDLHLECPLYAAMGGNGKIHGNGRLLERTEFAQAAIFAFEVAMFRLLQSFNVCPDFVTGHSLGEIVSAHVAGALSLREAAAIVTARGRLMDALPANGGMVSISATEDEVVEYLSRHEHETGVIQAAIAVVNSQNSVVVSGTVEAVTAVSDRFTTLGRRAGRLRNVNHAFHSPMMDPILHDLEVALAPLLDGNGKLTMSLVSTVTGVRAEAAQLSSWKHWTRHVREPVRFADAVKTLQEEGVSAFLEVGPSAVLSPHVPGAVATSSQVNTLLGALGQLWTVGVQVNWQAVFEGSGACLVDLPVYAFQRRRYWLNPPKPRAGQHGLPDAGAMEHGVLLSATSIPETGKILCSGYLSTKRQPWLRDHVIGGQVIVPASAFTELALRASRECTETLEMMMLEELAFVAPLALSLTEDEEFQVHVLVGEPQENGKRSVDVHSRPSGSPTQHEWTRHATGTLEPRVSSPSDNGDDDFTHSKRPTSNGSAHQDDGESVDVSKAYAVLADEVAISYGPSFQGVRAIWRQGHDNGEDRAELRARIDPPRGQGQLFGLHPALLDAALHASLLAAPDPASGTIRLPFLLRGVQFLARAGPGPILAQIRELGEDRISVTLRSESTGALVAEVSEVVTRAWQPGPVITEPATGNLYRLEWTGSASTTPNGGPTPEPLCETDEVFRVQGARGGGVATAGKTVKSAVHDAVAEALCVIQKWSAEKTYAGGRLVMVTENAMVEDSPDVVAAAVWGFVRSAQAELSGGRIVLVDLDGSTESETAILPALASREELIAIRGGTIMTPRLSKVAPTPAQVSASAETPASPSTLDVSGTVLVTGGTGGLGALLSRHIVRTYGAKQLLLVSRSGMKAPAARQLYEDLRYANTDAVVRIEECDCGDRDQLAAVLAGNDSQGYPPISAVIHCAGVVDDAVLGSQSPQRVSRVLRPKVDAAWNLHELVPTKAGSFVLFSSYVGIVGNEGQAGYTAGNAFLDALARFRVAHGLSALSLAWGPWLNQDGMAAENKLAIPSARLTNAQPLTDQQGLQLFDMALQTSTLTQRVPVLAPLLLRGPFPLVPSASNGAASKTKKRAQGVVGTWRARLAASPPERRNEVLLGLVQAEAAAVLGYPEGDDVPDQSFAELGFDSVTSVLLGNRLRALTGLHDIPVTVSLDYDTVPALAQYLSARLDLARLEEPEPEAQLPMTDEDMVEAPRPVADSHGKGKRSSASRTAGPENEQIDLEMFRGLGALHKRLSQLGQYTAAADVLASASLALPTFNMGSNLASLAAPPQRLATGPSDPSNPASLPLVLLAPFFPPIIIEGFRSSVYSAMAAEMNGERDVFELPHPEGLAIPDNLDTLAAMHVSTIREHFSGPIILGGYSAGGTVAHAVASKLTEGPAQEQQKVRLAGFVLIDTYLTMTGRGDPDWLNALPAEALTTRAGGLVHMLRDFDLALAKVGGYFRTLRDLKLHALPAALSTLFVRAQHPTSKMPKDEDEWRPSWPRADFTVEIPGSHLELLDKRYAPAAAAEIQRWARGLADCARMGAEAL